LELGPVNLTYQTSNDRTRVRTPTTSALANVRASLRLRDMLDSLRTAPVDSTYFAYDTLSIPRRPPIYLFMVESYGTVLNDHPALRGPFRSLLRRTDSVFAAEGWHRATARCAVPVRGGRSWLSIASLFTGVRVKHQLLYNRFQDAALHSDTTIPHLVRFLDQQGYRTIALQPFTFERPGLPVHNLYDFDTTIYRKDLNYRGPDYGLANAPDQYSLHYTHETYLAPAQQPFFLFFETVDSHSLWNYGLPPYPDDWRQFNAQTRAHRSPHPDSASFPPVFLPDSITAPIIYDQPTHLRYLRHVAHEWRVLREYLTAKAPPGSLVLLMGDHQPPLLDTNSSTVPLHVLSTDSTLVDLAQRHGFTAGLQPTGESARLRQEGLYSFLVHLLAAYDRPGAAAAPTALPPLKPTGVSPSLLLP
ncbi:MAG: sulfatase-like hydrolase/transferase, partial [Salinibacter sp.]